jgi:uncharacterized protein YukJ
VLVLTVFMDGLTKETDMKLTEKEKAMLKAFIAEGVDCMGANSAEELKADNMTWQDGGLLMLALGWDKETVGGVMASLEAKGLIADYGEPLPERKGNAWTATDQGIDLGWELL